MAPVSEAELRRRAEQLLGHRRAARLGQDGDHPGRAPARRPVGAGRRRSRLRPDGRTRPGPDPAAGPAAGSASGPPSVPRSGRRAGRARVPPRRPVPRPVRRGRAGPGRAPWPASRRPPSGCRRRPRAPGRARAASIRVSARRRHSGPALGVDLAGVAEALGHRQHGGQRDLHLLRPVVVLELEVPDRAPGPPARGRRWRRGGRAARPARARPARSPRRWSCGRAARGRRGRRRAARRPGRAPWPGCRSRRTPGRRRAGPSSAPQATASRRTSSAPGGPSVTTVQVPPLSRARVTPCGHGPAAVRVHLDAPRRRAPAGRPELERLGQRDLLGQRRDPQRDHRPPGSPGGGSADPAVTRAAGARP